MKRWGILLLIGLPQWLYAQSLDWQDTAYIEKAFIEIAFKREYQSGTQRLNKWTTPIRYQVHYEGLEPVEMVNRLVTAHLNHLAHITEHSIRPSANQTPANLKVIITPEANYLASIQKYTRSNVQDIERTSHCMATFRLNSAQAIIGATVIIPLDHVMERGLLPACVVEELTQVMGLPNDSNWVAPSIANDASKLDLLTGLDYVFLKLLYRPELKPGMSLQTARPIIQHQLNQFSKQGLIQQAPFKVNQRGLYPLLFN